MKKLLAFALFILLGVGVGFFITGNTVSCPVDDNEATLMYGKPPIGSSWATAQNQQDGKLVTFSQVNLAGEFDFHLTVPPGHTVITAPLTIDADLYSELVTEIKGPTTVHIYGHKDTKQSAIIIRCTA